MRHILLILAFLLPASIPAQDIRAFLSQQLSVYPQSHLLDIYKSCFQDYMGAEHLVSDRESVKAYLHDELKDTDIDDMQDWYYEPCGIKGNYVRVSLRAVKEGHITEDMLLDAFVRSANTARRPSVKSWRKQWYNIISTIEKMNLDLPDYNKEKELIDSILAQGRYALSHSGTYRNAYHPHYRIISKSIFEHELKRYLPSR